MSGLNWDKDRRAALWRKGAQMQRAENLAVDRVLAAPRYRENPATEKQIEYLQLLLAKRGRPPLDRIVALKMTRSEASNLINSLRDGDK